LERFFFAGGEVSGSLKPPGENASDCRSKKVTIRAPANEQIRMRNKWCDVASLSLSAQEEKKKRNLFGFPSP